MFMVMVSLFCSVVVWEPGVKPNEEKSASAKVTLPDNGALDVYPEGTRTSLISPKFTIANPLATEAIPNLPGGVPSPKGAKGPLNW
jgi:hypothetical protein